MKPNQITDAMQRDFLYELNVHITKTEMAVCYNIIQNHLERQDVPTKNPLAVDNQRSPTTK